MSAINWPIGAYLRFRLDADMQGKYCYLRGSAVKVLGPPEFVGPNDGTKTWSIRQQIYSFGHQRVGLAKPEHLEPFPDDRELRELETAQERSESEPERLAVYP